MRRQSGSFQKDLKDAVDLKLWGHDPRGAQELLEGCWQQAQELGCYREMVAYRLAHVLLRQSDADLERIENLLEVACGGAELGPRPWIYRLAVAHRRGQPVDELWSKAKEQIGLSARQLPEHRQGENHNLLELAGYFLDKPYAGNLTSPWSDLWPPGAENFWVLSTDDRLTLRAPERVARSHFHRVRHNFMVAFELCPQNSMVNDRNCAPLALSLLYQRLKGRNGRGATARDENQRQLLATLKRAIDPELPQGWLDRLPFTVIGLVDVSYADNLRPRDERSR